ncbi:hypothetical protein BV210_14445 [Halorientalis sp. IM1011]|uniref:glycosyltransferase family 39 protein n=1 Tax=Halorientalis sp. IM1011 TaxID=1932360 RepID=UPI00097CD093|nr:glycosyltransferase family 39 protein [Halorientalis sp. IM1011]AQL43829.1 hypothetical protein BV210_14445 [Halorientalis sp. IM1011]
MDLRERRVELLGVSGLLVLAAALRVAFLTSESLWTDEAATLYYVRSFSYRELLFEVPITETHPPLYYPFMKLWTGLTGTSVFGLRLPSVLFGVGTVAVTYAVGRELYSHRAGLLGGGLVAVSRFHISHSQSVRMYALLSFLGAVSFLAFVRFRDGGTTRDHVGYVVATALSIYTHVFGLFVLVVQNLYVGTTPFVDRVDETISWRRWAVLQGAVAALTAPWAYVLLSRVLSVSSGGPPARLGWIPEPSLAVFRQTITRYFGFGALPGPSVGPWVVLAVGVAAVYGFGVVTKGTEPTDGLLSRLTDSVDGRTYLLGLWAVVPLGLLFVVSKVVVPLYVIRYTIVASLPLFVLVGAAIDGLGSDRRTLVVAAVLLVLMVGSLPGYYATDQNGQWDEAAAHVESEATAGDRVLVTNYHPGFVQTKTAFDYYFSRSGVPVTGIPDGIDPARVGNLTAEHDTVWAVFAYTVPSHERAIRTRLNASFTPVDTRTYHGGITVVRYERVGDTNGG